MSLESVYIQKMNYLKPDEDWSFSDISRKKTLYITHGYHRYPAKFIPQLVRKLINQYSDEGDIILDPYGGCGTTLVEAKISNRSSIGIDINRVAVLISKAKTSVLNPITLKKKNGQLIDRIRKSRYKKNRFITAHPRLKYWFKDEQYNQLYKIYHCLMKESNNKFRTFYLCCFSNILKNCSIWYSKSIKPMRDLNKNIGNPFLFFSSHLDYMTKKNQEFYDILKGQNSEYYCKMIKGDARNIYLKKNSVDLIVTSPPYVTSYEYADLHQLSSLWFNYTDDISKIKKEFVGTSSRKKAKRNINSKIANRFLKKLAVKDKRYWRNITNYFSDLSKSYSEMYRILKQDKYACIILGDTEYLGLKIPNSKVTIELLVNCGFQIKKVIKRKLSSKIFTPYRDKNGRFANSKHGNKRRIYQYEYLIIARKGD